MTNLSLDELREVAGVFISEADFQVIELKYLAYLKENDFADTEYEAEQFIEDWKAEQEKLGNFTETEEGYIKYYCGAGAGDIKLTTEQFLNNLDMRSYHWENLCRSYWKIFEEILNTGNVNKQLLSHILSEETIS